MSAHRIAIHTDGTAVQGNERQIELIARGLLARGHSVHIVARSGSPAWDLFAATGAVMSDARPRGAADLVSALRFTRWLRRTRPDALLFTSWRRLWIAGLAARTAGVPNTVMRFGGRHDIPRGWRGAHYRQALTRFVDRIYANSTIVREHLLRTLPELSPARVHLVWNGVPTAAAEPAPVRSLIGAATDARIVTAVGGLVRLKGFDVLVRALATLDVKSHLVVCGDGPERESLARLASDLAVSGRVHLIGRRADIPAILAGSDVFVLSSRTEGFSVALLEAMRAGLPIVATDVGGVRDALCDENGDERAGWIVPPDDVAAMATAIRNVIGTLETPATRARAEEAKRRALERFTVERMVRDVERVLLPGSAT